MVASNSKLAVWNRALARIGETQPLEEEDDPNREAAAVCSGVWDDIVGEVFEASLWSFAKRQRALQLLDSQTTDAAGNGVLTSFDIPVAYLETTQVTVARIAAGGGVTTLTAVTDYTITPASGGSRAFITLTGGAPTVGQSIRITVTTERVGWEHVYALPADYVTGIALIDDGARFDLLPVENRIEFELMSNDAGDGQVLCCDVDGDDFDALVYIARIDTIAAWPRKFTDAVIWRLAVELALAVKKDEAMSMRFEKRYLDALDIADAQSANVGHSNGAITPSLAVRGGMRPWLPRNVR